MEASKVTFGELIQKSEIPVLVDFYADWCGPCKIMAPVLQKIASEYKGKLKIIKVDVDKNQAAALGYKIRGIPTLILFNKGNMLWRESGAVPEQMLKNILDQHLV